MEIALYKEAINVNPFEYDGAEGLAKWAEVGENTALALGLEKSLSWRTAKTKVYTQVNYFLADDNRCRNKLVFNYNLSSCWNKLF